MRKKVLAGLVGMAVLSALAGLAVVAQGFGPASASVVAQSPASSSPPQAQPAVQKKYDLLLRGGRVIDPRNKISAVRDVAIAAGKIAAVEAKIDPADALKTVDVSGLHVTPGLVDIHTHVFAGTGERARMPATTASTRTASRCASASPRSRTPDARGGATSTTSSSGSSIGRRRACSPS